jgi:hypothetical protein
MPRRKILLCSKLKRSASASASGQLLLLRQHFKFTILRIYVLNLAVQQFSRGTSNYFRFRSFNRTKIHASKYIYHLCIIYITYVIIQIHIHIIHKWFKCCLNKFAWLALTWVRVRELGHSYITIIFCKDAPSRHIIVRCLSYPLQEGRIRTRTSLCISSCMLMPKISNGPKTLVNKLINTSEWKWKKENRWTRWSMLFSFFPHCSIRSVLCCIQKAFGIGRTSLPTFASLIWIWIIKRNKG